MAVTWSDISELYAAGNDAATIAATLAADPRHVRDVPATGGDASAGKPDLLHVLSAKMDLLYIDEGAAWTGLLVGYMTSLDETNQLRVGFRKLLSILQLTGRQVYCKTHPPTGYLVTAITQVCQSLTSHPDYAGEYDAAAVQAEMDALTGGVKFAGVTEADVQALIDLQLRQGAVDSITTRASEAREAAQAAFRAGGSIAEIVAAAEASWSN